MKLMRVLAMVEDVPLRRWAETHDCQRYVGSSMKGEAAIDWSDRQARRKLPAEIVADADRLLGLARQAQAGLSADSTEGQAIVDSAELLGQLLLQDVKRDDDGDADGRVSLKDGVSKDRIVSVHDREMRHGHKSSKRRFDGHKAAVVVDTGTQLITAVDVLPGNAWDSTGALDLVQQSEIAAGAPVVEAMGDTAYGDGGTRQYFADAGQKLVARVPGRPNSKHFPKDAFVIDLMAGTCTCPAGQVTRHRVPMATHTDLTGRTYKQEGFQFDGAVCKACPLRAQCTSARAGVGRTVRLHPQEALLQEARRLQGSPAYDEYRRGWWPNTVWRDWFSWGSARPGTSVVPRPDSSFTWPPPWPT